MNFSVFLLFHAVYSTIFAYLLSILFGGLTSGISIVGLFLGTLLAVWHSRGFKNIPQPSKGGIELTLLVLILYAAIRHFMWLLYPAEKGFATLSANNFGDLPLHINYIRSIAGHADFPFLNPSFALEKLRYPLGGDFYSAIWESLGVRLEAHLFLTGLAATLASLYLLFSFGGWWTVGGFFFNGGWLGWLMILSGAQQDRQDGIEWKNLFLSVFITQRGFLFALPMGLLLLISMHRHFSGESPLTSRQKTALGFIWGFLPLFHLHSFVAVSLLMALIAFSHLRVAGVYSLLSSRMAIIAYLPAFLFVMHSTEWLKKSSIAYWSLGWMNGDQPLLTFIWNNFGLWLFVPLLTLSLLYFSKKRFSKKQKHSIWIEFLGALAIFIFFFNFMLAPWAWDNIKVLIWPYLVLLRVAYVVIEPQIESFFDGAIKPAFATVLLLPGLMSVYSSMRGPTQTSVEIYSFSDLANSKGAIEQSDANSIFAAAPTHNHALTYFGKLRAVGYEGHLWSHGIDSAAAVQDLKTLMNGDEKWLEAAKRLKVTHIFWGPEERKLYGDTPKAWMEKLKNVSRVPGYGVYRIN